MKKFIFYYIFIFSITISTAQVGIGTTSPDLSSSLDISSTNSGLLIPRISLASVVDTATIPSPATSLLIYNTNAGISFGYGVGYYYWNGTQWEKLQTLVDDFWSRSSTGDLFPKTISDNIGIGTTSPNAPLQFANTITNRKIVLWESANNDNQYYGFGINGGTLRYQVDDVAADHIFFAGVNATTSNELMRIKGNGNVGINNNNPTTAKLVISGSSGQEGIDLSSTDLYANLRVIRNNLSSFDNDMYIGYGSGISSNLHFYSNNNETMTVSNNNVGIGISPTQKLDIAGKIKITDGSQAIDKVLTSDATGVGTWKPTGINNISATLSSGVNIPYTTANYLQTGTSITLPPGRYALNVTMLLSQPGNALTPADSSFWVRSSFSDSPGINPLSSSDIQGSSLVSGNLTGSSFFSLMTGTIIINNPNPILSKTYYYVAGNVSVFNTTGTVVAIGGNIAENNIIAYKLQ